MHVHNVLSTLCVTLSWRNSFVYSTYHTLSVSSTWSSRCHICRTYFQTYHLITWHALHWSVCRTLFQTISLCRWKVNFVCFCTSGINNFISRATIIIVKVLFNVFNFFRNNISIQNINNYLGNNWCGLDLLFLCPCVLLSFQNYSCYNSYSNNNSSSCHNKHHCHNTSYDSSCIHRSTSSQNYINL